ncbi:hypothetical protein H0H81_005743 [Sphagnurus paluster]|uniref:Uncharacterized protein n=1 Tax=Sphagnurus paluster TaxID=117069 RepID=A0A9P7FXK2_9AGAR|nr:hypothetical protein H0H81_005743 [Sphagnurus paluster]
MRNLSLSAPLSIYRALTLMNQTTSYHRPRFPILEYVHFAMPHMESDRAATRQLTSRSSVSLLNCAKLQEVYLESADHTFGFITDNLVVGIPYDQLTDLTIIENALNPERARSILIGCSSLIRCSFIIGQWGPDEVVTPAGNITILPHLQVLIATFTGLQPGGRISPFFDTITMPALVKLTVSAPHASDEHIAHALGRLQARSRAPLRRLALAKIRVLHQNIPGLLSMLPQLTHLHIEAPRDRVYYRYTDILSAIRYQLDHTAERAEQFMPELKVVFIADNLHSQYSDGNTGRVNLNFMGKRDVSKAFRDEVVLDAIENRCGGDVDWARFHSSDLKFLEVVTVKWKNVPQEWREDETQRRGLTRKAELESTYPVRIYLPLEP